MADLACGTGRYAMEEHVALVFGLKKDPSTHHEKPFSVKREKCEGQQHFPLSPSRRPVRGKGDFFCDLL